MKQDIEIDIHINGPYAIRIWPAVPRVGEEIMLTRVDPETKEFDPQRGLFRPKLIEENARAVVTSVVWGTSEESERGNRDDRLRVSVVCQWKEP